MGNVKIEKLGGMMPAWDSRNIPDNQADFARNTFLYSGAAIGWRQPKLLRNLLNGAAKYAYRVPTISQGIAGANLLFTGNPNEGDTVTLGEIVYRLTANPSQPFDVKLQSTTFLTASALFLAMNFGTFDPTIVNPNTPANPAIASANPYVGFPSAFTGNTTPQPGNTLILVPIIPSGTMILNSISVMPAASSAGAKFTGVLYNDVNLINAAGTAYVDIPSSLVETGSEVTGCTAGTAITSVLPVPVTLIGGVTYWIGFLMDTPVALQLASLGTQGVSQTVTYTNGPPNPFQTTSLSGVTVGGSTVGSLQTQYNTAQPNWQLWGNMVTISPDDALNNFGAFQVGGAGSFFTALTLQAPAFGAAFNLTQVAVNSGAMLWLKDFASFADVTNTFVGGANQTADTTINGVSNWLEFADQDTNVVRTPVVDDVFQRYYFASPSLPPQYNTYQRILAGQPPFLLGVPAPPLAPALSVNGTGGNPTQVGFPGSTTPNTYQFLQPWFVGGQTYFGFIPPNNSGLGQSRLVLYPMQVSVGATVNDIGIQLAKIGGNGVFVFVGIIFADISATDPTQVNKPGELIAIGAVGDVIGANGTATPTPVLSTFAVPPTLLAKTQYWIGAVMSSGGSLPGYQADADVELAMADLATQGVTTILPVASLTMTDPKTGGQMSYPTTPNFLDLQLWADLSPGTTGAAQEETRAYAYTWVTAYGEEGPPSPPALLDAFDNATWTLGLQPPLAQDLGIQRNIVKSNIYRTVPSQHGGTVFFFVGSVSAGATTFVDTFTDDVVAANLILPSTTWFGPPATLEGMVTMPNGMIAGFRANEVWFCEPFRPHAWPSGYVMTTDYPIVGLGVVNTTLVACTETNPQTFTGVNPSVMTQERIALPEPCTSRGGILSTDTGVYYPSVNGLIKVMAKTAQNITQAWITREKWDQLTPQKFVRATKNVSTYFAFGTTGVTNGQGDASVAQRGFTLELSEIADRESFTNWPQVGGHRIGFSTMLAPLGTDLDNVLHDPWSGVTLLLTAGAIYQYDFTDPAPQITPFLWRSKKFEGMHRENFAALRVWFDTPPGGPQVPPATRTEVPFAHPPVTAAVMPYQPGMFGVVRVIADGFYITERELRYSTELMQIAANQKYTTWQVEVEGVVSVSHVKMSTTVKELGTFK